MKTTDEIAAEVFRRRDEFIRKRRESRIRIASEAASLVLAVGLLLLSGLPAIGKDHVPDSAGSDAGVSEPAVIKTPPPPADAGTQAATASGSGTEIPSREEMPGTEEPVPGGQITKGPTYPDDVWGGCWEDGDGQLIVLLMENTAEQQQNFLARNPDLNPETALFRKADYSQAYLRSLMETLSRADLPSCVSSIGYMTDRNRIGVWLTEEDPAAMEEIRAYDSLGGAILFQALPKFTQPPPSAKGPMP